MAVSRRTNRLSDYRSMLDRKGEVEIGAQARRRWWRNVFMAVLGVGLIAAAVWLCQALWPAEEGGPQAAPYPVKMQCTECGYTAVVYVKHGERFPLICPRCKLRSFWQLWRCKIPECGCEFIPPPNATLIRCPECGSVSVGTAVVDEAPEQPAESP